MLYPQQNDVRNKLDLSGIWDFKTDPEEVGAQNGWFNGLAEARPIAVPGSWNEQYEDLFNYLGLAWYVLTRRGISGGAKWASGVGLVLGGVALLLTLLLV